MGKYFSLLDKSSRDCSGTFGFCTAIEDKFEKMYHVLKVNVNCWRTVLLKEVFGEGSYKLPVRLAMRFPEYVALITTRQNIIVPVTKRNDP